MYVNQLGGGGSGVAATVGLQRPVCRGGRNVGQPMGGSGGGEGRGSLVVLIGVSKPVRRRQ